MPAIGQTAPGRAAVWDEPAECPRRPLSVPLLWWLPLIAVLMLGATTVAILPGSGSGIGVLVATAINILGYALVWFHIRPRWLQVGLYAWPNIESVPRDCTDPPTITLPAVGRRRAIAWPEVVAADQLCSRRLGATFAWAVVANMLIHPEIPAAFRTRAVVRTRGPA